MGRSAAGKLLYGYTRVPWYNYHPPLLSIRTPQQTPGGFSILVENFGQVASSATVMKIRDKRTGITGSPFAVSLPVIAPYESTRIAIGYNNMESLPALTDLEVTFE